MDNKDKVQLIQKITDEVGVLHPLLKDIFPKLPNVISYEYTHGPTERGADFVLQVENPTTKRHGYVGVVVKCGKIGSGKVSEIEEQIKECEEERAYQVLNKIRCSEVWILSSGGYSERAKEKIIARFSGKKLEFFGAEDLASFVDDHSPYFWHQLPVGLSEYLQGLSRKLDILDNSSNISIISSNYFIELDCYERIVKKYLKNAKNTHEIKNINFYDEAIFTKIGLLEAEMGFGKSKLTRKLAMHLCLPETYKAHKVIPIYTSFKNFAENNNLNLKALVENTLGKVISFVEESDSKALIILDGLDEFSSPDNTSGELFLMLSDQVKKLNNYNLLITTRPIKSLTEKASLYESARVFGIRPLSLTKIVGFVQNTCSKNNLPARLFEDLKKSQLFKQLPHSPIAAALFSNLLVQGQQEVPQSLTELYAKSTDLMLGRWDQKKELATEKQFKTAHTIAEHLAAYYVEHKLVYVSRTEVIQIISDYLGRRNTGITEKEITNILLKRSNLLGKDDETDTVMFRHRSFAEYLCASKKAKDRSLNVKDVALDPYWSNILFFYTGSLQDCADVLVEITSLVPKDELENWVKIISVPNCLLAAYLTEFEVIESSLLQVLIESAKLFLKIKSGDSKTILTDLSIMHLLYIFKSMIVESIGYEYFAKAFENITLKLNESNLDHDLKCYAIFFLGNAALEMGNEEPFKFLIDSVGVNNLPLPISLGIKCELNGVNNLKNNKLLKLHKAKLNKILTLPNKSTKAETFAVESKIRQYFEQPIKQNTSKKSGS